MTKSCEQLSNHKLMMHLSITYIVTHCKLGLIYEKIFIFYIRKKNTVETVVTVCFNYILDKYNLQSNKSGHKLTNS